MAVSPVFDFDIPSPYDEFFIHGERALSVADPIDSAPGRTNYLLSKWMDFEGGDYLIRVAAVDSSTWGITTGPSNTRVVFYTKVGSGQHEATIYIPRGRQRLNILLAHIDVDPGLCLVAFSLHRQGKLVYASDGDGWVFDTTTILDEDVPPLADARSLLPLFSILPNWQVPIVERIVYSTEILNSESDVEQRRGLLTSFRRTFEASFARQSAKRTRIDSFLTGTGRNLFMLPLWHEQYPLEGMLGSTLVFPVGTLAVREFREGMFCLLNAKDPNVYERIQIESIDLETDTITFTDVPVGTWGVGSRITPLRIAFVADSASLTNVTDAVGSVQIRFELAPDQPAWFVPDWDGVERLFRFKPNRASDIQVNYERPTALVDREVFGPTDIYDSEQRSQLTLSGSLQFRGRDALMRFRKFIDVTRGRALRFWIPSFTTDFQAVADLDDDYIDVQNVGFTHFYRTKQHFRSVVVITFNDGTSARFIRITDSEELSTDVERVHLEEPITKLRSSIARISFLMAVRFDQDTFELQHLVDESAAVQASFIVRTVDDTGLELPGDSDRFRTSLIYPLEMIEGLDVLPGAPESYVMDHGASLDVSAGVEEVTVTTVIAYKSLDADPESLDVSAGVELITVTVVIAYKEIEAESEALNVSAGVEDITVAVVINYLEHEIPGEGFDVGVGVEEITVSTA